MRLVVASVAALSGCGRLQFDPLIDATVVPGDACTFGAWSPPVLIAELDSAGDESSPTISTDTLSLVFASDGAGGAGGKDLYLATRPNPTSAFSPPQNLTLLNAIGAQQAPSFSFDGLTLYYADRGQLFTTTRPSSASPFTSPTPVTDLATVLLYGIEITAAGDELFFSRNNAIERATISGDVFTETGPVTELNAANTCCPTLTHDGLTIYIATDRGGAGLDIYSATRATIGAPFSVPTPVLMLSAPSLEDDPDLSDDGRTMILRSDQGASSALYTSTRSCN